MTRRPLTLLLGALTAALGLPTAFRLVGDSGQKYLVLAVVVVPLLVLPLAATAVLQLLLHRRRLAALTAVLVLLDVAWLVPLYVGDDPPPGRPFVVLTANLRLGLADAGALVALVRDEHVDALATQELTPDAVARLQAAGLERELPHAELDARPGAEGCGLWSRWPLTSVPPLTATFASPGARLQVPGGDVVLRVLHPFPATLAGAADYRRDYAGLTRQVRDLPDDVPTVLAGDLNATVDTAAFRDLLGERFRDAAEVAGSGLSLTWGPRVGDPALLHLDHVLVDRRTGVDSTAVRELPGSDHRAQVARLVLAGDQPAVAN